MYLYKRHEILYQRTILRVLDVIVSRKTNAVYCGHVALMWTLIVKSHVMQNNAGDIVDKRMCRLRDMWTAA